jgi:hypothetical protein
MQFKIHAKFTPNRDTYFLSCCFGKNVLHVGACDAPYTMDKFYAGLLFHCKLEKVCKNLVGIDIDDEALNSCAI